MTDYLGTMDSSRLRDEAYRPDNTKQDAPINAGDNSPSLLEQAVEELMSAGSVEQTDGLCGRLAPNKEYARPIKTTAQRFWRLTRFASALAIVGGFGYVAYELYFADYTQVAVAPVAKAQSGPTYKSQPVDESQITKQMVQDYRVSGSMPKRIQFPQIDVHARVQAKGLGEQGQLMSAKNANDLSWYTGSALPGRSGVTLMVGAMAGPSRPTAFSKASTLKNGEKITVTMGDDSAVFYKVVAIEAPSKVEMSDLLSRGVAPETLKVVLHDKADKTGDNSTACTVVIAERFQDPLPRYKSIRRW